MEILSSMELQFTNLRHTAATDEWHHFFEFVFQGFPEEYKLIFYFPPSLFTSRYMTFPGYC